MTRSRNACSSARETHVCLRFDAQDSYRTSPCVHSAGTCFLRRPATGSWYPGLPSQTTASSVSQSVAKSYLRVHVFGLLHNLPQENMTACHASGKSLCPDREVTLVEAAVVKQNASPFLCRFEFHAEERTCFMVRPGNAVHVHEFTQTLRRTQPWLARCCRLQL